MPTLPAFIIAGDTLFYKFSSGAIVGELGYKFTVTRGYVDRFDTGYQILSGVLSVPKFVRSETVSIYFNFYVHK